MCITRKRLQAKHMGTPIVKPRWLSKQGPWELVLVEGGGLPVGLSINPTDFAATMVGLSRRAQAWFKLPHDTS